MREMKKLLTFELCCGGLFHRNLVSTWMTENIVFFFLDCMWVLLHPCQNILPLPFYLFSLFLLSDLKDFFFPSFLSTSFFFFPFSLLPTLLFSLNPSFLSSFFFFLKNYVLQILATQSEWARNGKEFWRPRIFQFTGSSTLNLSGEGCVRLHCYILHGNEASVRWSLYLAFNTKLLSRANPSLPKTLLSQNETLQGVESLQCMDKNSEDNLRGQPSK